jgi:hypothetical protein
MIAYQAICEVHGPMRHYQDEQVWRCLGFDGEGHDINPVLGFTDESAERVFHGITRWPGVRVEISVQ